MLDVKIYLEVRKIMYSAKDIRRRIEEKKKETVANQLKRVSGVTENMFKYALSEQTFCTEEALISETLSQVKEYGFDIYMIKEYNDKFEYVISVPEEKEE